MKTTSLKKVNIGEIVANDFRAAKIFKDAGIDFCCGGDHTLEEICAEKNIKTADIEQKIKHLENTVIDFSHDFKEWKLDILCDHIVNKHHKLVMDLLPQLVFYTQKIAFVHSTNHPELIRITELFAHINKELLQHLKNEEEILFPAIKAVLKNNDTASKAIIISEIKRMKGEHEFAGGAMDTINDLSKNYQVPDDGCSTFTVTYKMLEQFEDDLHIHVHIENNILYPKALLLANEK